MTDSPSSTQVAWLIALNIIGHFITHLACIHPNKQTQQRDKQVMAQTILKQNIKESKEG